MNNTTLTAQQIFGMNNNEVIPDYVWKSLIVSKRSGVNLFRKVFEGSMFYDFWVLMSAPVK